MKEDRSIQIAKFASNLMMMLDDRKEKVVSFTTDCKNFDIVPLIDEIAKVYENTKKVLILTFSKNIEKENHLCLNNNLEILDNFEDKIKDYDLVIVECPNVITTKYYLQLTKIIKEFVIVVKSWKSKLEDVENISKKLKEQQVEVLGTLLQK